MVYGSCGIFHGYGSYGYGSYGYGSYGYGSHGIHGSWLPSFMASIVMAFMAYGS